MEAYRKMWVHQIATDGRFSREPRFRRTLLINRLLQTAVSSKMPRSFRARIPFARPLPRILSRPGSWGRTLNEAISGPGNLPSAEDGNVALEVTDLLYAETQEPLRKMIAGKTVGVIGQFIPGATHDQFKLVRIFLWCCAADARPIYIPVALSAPVDVSDMEWVKVTGTAEFSTNEGQNHVLRKADSVDASDPPEEAMLY
jgi:hypothetical protein